MVLRPLLSSDKDMGACLLSVNGIQIHPKGEQEGAHTPYAHGHIPVDKIRRGSDYEPERKAFLLCLNDNWRFDLAFHVIQENCFGHLRVTRGCSADAGPFSGSSKGRA